MAIRIPVSSGAATHCTDGLAGFPAIDFFGSLGEDVFIGEGGTVSNPHLITWRQGFGGWTFYYVGDSGRAYFITHLDEGFRVGAGRLEAGALIGHLTRSAAHAALINGAHVHVGVTYWTGPGLSCGVAAPPYGSGHVVPATTRPPRTKPRHQTPRTQLPAPPVAPGSPTPPGTLLRRRGTVVANWHNLMLALGSTLPAQDFEARKMIRRFPRAVR